ncbi:MAG: 3'-5' exonuclease [Acidobacteriota bacterium]
MPHAYCCIDVEASGPVPGLFDLVSIGAVAVQADPDGRHRLSSEPWHVLVAPQGGRQLEEAMAIHGIPAGQLEAEGRPLAEAMQALTDWARSQQRDPEQRLVFVGHNAPFDWSYISYCYHACELENPFGWKALDTKALAMGRLDLDWFDTNKETLETRLSLPEQDASRVHQADYDALYQAEILCALLDHRSA